MATKTPFNSLLVPTDFSKASDNAIAWAVKSIDGDDAVIILLHVVDESLVEMIAEHEFADREEVESRMRQQAAERLERCKQAVGTDVETESVVAVGLPFLEIIRKSDDFAVDAIVMGRVGNRGQVEKLLFGSTVEKVLRGAQRPVVMLPESSS